MITTRNFIDEVTSHEHISSVYFKFYQSCITIKITHKHYSQCVFAPYVHDLDSVHFFVNTAKGMRCIERDIKTNELHISMKLLTHYVTVGNQNVNCDNLQ